LEQRAAEIIEERKIGKVDAKKKIEFSHGFKSRKTDRKVEPPNRYSSVVANFKDSLEYMYRNFGKSIKRETDEFHNNDLAPVRKS